MQEVKVGKNFILPINGFKIRGFDFTYLTRIEFIDNLEDEWKYQLIIQGEYRIKRYGKMYKFTLNDIEGCKILLDFSNEKIKYCKADKYGHLWLETEIGNEIEVEDGPYENWEFKVYKQIGKLETKVHLIGGVGNTTMF